MSNNGFGSTTFWDLQLRDQDILNPTILQAQLILGSKKPLDIKVLGN